MRLPVHVAVGAVLVAVCASCGPVPSGPGAGAGTTVTVPPPATSVATAASTPSAPRPRPALTFPRPPIQRDFIPITERRKAETVAYAQRHYGGGGSRIAHPRVIVEHLTENGSIAVTYDTFAPDVPDIELHELPGLCSQFAIGSDGAIVQFAPVDFMCRHTVGLNWTAIGIEHVGFREQDVLGNPAQLRASLRLTTWLRCRYRIPVHDVIGHAESLSSPYHHERVAALRSQTHSDWQPWAMRRYRALLRRTSC